MKPAPKLGEQEIEILRFVSSRESVSVREAADVFEKSHGLARTTVLTVMERLRAKGCVSRTKVDGVYQYREKIDTESFLAGRVSTFVDKTLGGSLSPLLSYFAGQKNLSVDEIEKLREIVREFDQQKGSKR
ncbi:MAG: BlaI/MecI/CopY family transcriptional regulator [Bdellovibrionaceae bacterium]|nr:BlaI/MecI/CopY family transcriptional regulator [Pseudobdellovibrionaceae bacterium]